MAATVDEIAGQDNTLAVIDGNSLMHRAFHAIGTPMSAPDGRPTNACFGFMAMLLKFIEDFKPNAIICAFDAGKPAFRMEALSQYKAQRPPMDPGLKAQFPMMEKLLEAMNIPVVRIQGWEGDDILGTLAKEGEAENKEVLLITGDKDAFQLATDHVNIVSTKKGITDVVVYDPDAVFERYGVTPEQVPDFLGLKGDPSDNIPGVAGIGEKGAAKLLQQYGSIEGIYDHIDSIKGKIADNLRENKQSAYDSRVVATISDDVPIDLDVSSISFPDFDPARVREAFGELHLNQHMNKLLELGKKATEAGQEAEAFVAEGSNHRFMGAAGSDAIAICSPVLIGEDGAKLVDDAMAAQEHLGVWVDEGAGPSLFGESHTLYVACSAGVAHIDDDKIDDVLARLVESAHMVCLDAKSVLRIVYPNDSGKPATLDMGAFAPERVFDLSLASYLLDSQRKDFSVEALCNEYLRQGIPDADSEHDAAAMRAASVLALESVLTKALDDDGSRRCFDTIEMPLLEVLMRMERTGVDLDTEVLDDLAASTGAQIEDIKHGIYREAGEEFNVDSPKQLGVILFEKLKLPAGKKTKTGYSTDAKTLERLRSQHALPDLVLEYRELAKMKSTYIDALPRLLGDDGRLHTNFNQTVTATGRLSSSDPNLQNIPVRTEFGRQIRAAFIPKDPGEVFLSADYSQIELRLLAHLSGDAGLVAAFSDGRDFHAATAARVFDVPIDEVTSQMRTRAKAVNFGIVYGQQAFGLAQSLGISFKEAQGMIDRYFDAYPRVREYLDDTVQFARDHGFVTTMFGRKRHIPEISSTNANLRSFGERTAMNHPMQGTAADIIKLAMIETSRRLEAGDFHARLCLQVHDELDFEVARDQADALGKMVEDVMEHVVSLDVPMDVSVSVGETWADAK